MRLCGRNLLLAVTTMIATVAIGGGGGGGAGGGVGVHCQKPSSVSKRHDVYIAGFFPFSPELLPETATGRGVMPAVKLAIEHINENSAVLRNYRLHMWWNDTQCNASVGVKAFFDMMYEEPHKLMLFGTACTQVTDPIAKASKHWHITQLSYADTDPMFTSSSFPNFFRMVPSENAFNTPRIRLLQYFNWTQVGTIYQNEPRFSLAHNRLVAELDSMNFTVLETQSLTTNVSIAVERLKEKDVRIILGNFNESWAKRIFCEAYRVGMMGRKYQWLIMGTYGERWWEDERDTPCSLSELAAALDGCILTDYLPLASNKVITISGITPSEYQQEYDSRRGSEYSRFHGYTYDGIWTAALAIQHAAHRIRSVKTNETIVDFRYRDKIWEKLFVEALKNTSFEGVTGPVRFYDNERKASILLKQFQSNEEVKIGEYNGQTELLDLSTGNAIRWKDGRGPPKDRTLLVFENSHVNFGLYFTLVVFAIIGIITATVFLIINIKYRNQRYIKMSSPYLNNLIIIGCILTYTSVIFLGLDSSLTNVQTFPYICAARAWLLMAGFSLAFGAMFSKTWRVHSIFTDVKLNKKVIKDYQLFIVVGVLLAFDVGIMTTWQITDPFYRATKNMESYIDSNSEDIQIIPVNEYCQSNRMTWFVGFIYAYKGLLMIFGAFLAWETRHVSIPALNDSKYVGMSVYNVVLMCVMGAAISFVLTDQQNYSFGIISVFILFCSTITVCLVFVPKVVELRRNPQGSIDKRFRPTLRPMSKTRRESSELEEHFKHAKTTNQKYRKLLQEKDNELQNLLRKFDVDEQKQLPAKILNIRDDASSHVIRKESTNYAAVPSATETTELSSGCSLNSSAADIEAIPMVNGQSNNKKKTTFSTCKFSSHLTEETTATATATTTTTSTVTAAVMDDKTKMGGSAGGGGGGGGDFPSLNTCEPLSSYCKNSPPSKPQSVGPTRRRSSLAHSPSAGTTSDDAAAEQMEILASSHPVNGGCRAPTGAGGGAGGSLRRTSVPTKRNSPAFVHQDELWLTQRQCKSKCLLNSDGTSPSDDEAAATSATWTAAEKSIMQRSVSEKSRDKYAHPHHRHHHHRYHHNQAQQQQQSSQQQQQQQMHHHYPHHHHQHQHYQQQQQQQQQPQQQHQQRHHHHHHHHHHQHSASVSECHATSNLKKPTPSHVQSTPNVLGTALSDEKLVDLAILPIFQKLLTERRGAAIASCPNIAIKCDIVEYL